MASSPQDQAALDEGESIDGAPAVRSLEEVLADPATSYWLKTAIQTLMERDPVDALNDVLVLAELLDERLRQALGIDGENP